MRGVEDILVPIVFFLTVAAIWGTWLLTKHKERITMIEKGLKAEDIKSLYERGTMRVNPLSSLKWGIVFVGIGLAVIIGMWLHEAYYVDEAIFPALIALFGGIGLIIFYVLAKKKATP